jgi:hypothetical protein
MVSTAIRDAVNSLRCVGEENGSQKAPPFEYHRVGCDRRPMVFRGDGTISVGGAGCEWYWTIRDGRLLIVGDDGRLTTDVTATSDGGWKGGGWCMKMPPPGFVVFTGRTLVVEHRSHSRRLSNRHVDP